MPPASRGPRTNATSNSTTSARATKARAKSGTSRSATNGRSAAEPGDVDGGETTSYGATAWQRLSQTFLRPSADRRAAKEPGGPPDFYRMTDDEKRAHITRIDPTERKIGIAASVLGVALAIYANVPFMIHKVKVPMTVKPVGKTCPNALTYTVHAGKATCNGIYPANHYLLGLVVALVLAIAIYVTVRIRRRAPLAFTIIMTGLAFGQLLILVPFGVAGGWIMLRAWRTQKYGAPTAKVKVEGWTPPPPRGTTRRATSSGPGRGSTRRRKGADTASSGRKPPSQNKRYTPKSPPKKKVSRPTT